MDNSQKTPAQADPNQPQVVSAVSSPNKEQAPIAPFIQSSEVLPPKELKEFGVDVIANDKPEIHPDIAKLGVKTSDANIPAPVVHSNVQILTKEEAARLEKGSVGDSMTWVAKLFVKFFKRPQLQGGSA